MEWIVDTERAHTIGIKAEKDIIPILSWGFEIGDWYSFYNSHQDEGLRWKLEEKEISCTNEIIKGWYHLRLLKGFYEITTHDQVKGTLLTRHYTVTPLEPSMLGDFVVRLALPALEESRAKIADQTIQHRSENIYHQYQTSEAMLSFPPSNTRIKFCATGSEFTDLSFWTYIRDEPPDRWIIHHRLLSEQNKNQVWSIRTRRFNAHARIARLLSRVAQKFWLYKECKGIRSVIPFHFQVGYLSCINDGDTLSIDATIELMKI